MRKSYLFKFSALLLIPFFFGCKGTNEKFISEGMIEYDATAVDQNNAMASLAPNKMLVKFKDNKSCVELSAGMGLIKMSFISDPETMTLTQLVKIFNDKSAHVFDSVVVNKENFSLSQFNIERTKETKMIAGYKCEKAIISFANNTHPSFNIYYTNDINIQKANWSNPFNQIGGVLMEYQINRYGLELKFTAKKVTKKEIDDVTFELPKDYKIISEKEMNDLFKNLQ